MALYQEATIELSTLLTQWLVKYKQLIVFDDSGEGRVKEFWDRIYKWSNGIDELSSLWERATELENRTKEREKKLIEVDLESIASPYSGKPKIFHGSSRPKSFAMLPKEILNRIFSYVVTDWDDYSRSLLTLSKRLYPVIVSQRYRYPPTITKSTDLCRIVDRLKRLPTAPVRHLKLHLVGPSSLTESTQLSRLLDVCPNTHTLTCYGPIDALKYKHVRQSISRLSNLSSLRIVDDGSPFLVKMLLLLPNIRALDIRTSQWDTAAKEVRWISEPIVKEKSISIEPMDWVAGTPIPQLPKLRSVRFPPRHKMPYAFQRTLLEGMEVPPLSHLELHTGKFRKEVLLYPALEKLAPTIQTLKLSHFGKYPVDTKFYSILAKCKQLQTLELLGFSLPKWRLPTTGAFVGRLRELFLNQCGGSGVDLELWMGSIKLNDRRLKVLGTDFLTYHKAHRNYYSAVFSGRNYLHMLQSVGPGLSPGYDIEQSYKGAMKRKKAQGSKEQRHLSRILLRWIGNVLAIYVYSYKDRKGSFAGKHIKAKLGEPLSIILPPIRLQASNILNNALAELTSIILKPNHKVEKMDCPKTTSGDGRRQIDIALQERVRDKHQLQYRDGPSAGNRYGFNEGVEPVYGAERPRSNFHPRRIIQRNIRAFPRLGRWG
ncbi:hypothetical protein BT69DRAFT_1298128 [Atractiella rhizophila]|nr:hypothetical protein BT69DRAFT_1298128 [Atractiella rhizophila]